MHWQPDRQHATPKALAQVPPDSTSRTCTLTFAALCTGTYLQPSRPTLPLGLAQSNKTPHAQRHWVRARLGKLLQILHLCTSSAATASPQAGRYDLNPPGPA